MQYVNFQDDTDVCNLPEERGECDNYVINFHYDPNEGRCRQFYYGGCGGNGNRFVTEPECESACINREPPPPPSEDSQGKL